MSVDSLRTRGVMKPPTGKRNGATASTQPALLAHSTPRSVSLPLAPLSERVAQTLKKAPVTATFSPFLLSTSKSSGSAARQYSNCHLLALQRSPLVHGGPQVPVGPWSPARTRSAAPPLSAAQQPSALGHASRLRQQDESAGDETSVRNLSSLFDAAQEAPPAPLASNASSPEAPEEDGAATEQRRLKQIEATKQSPIYQSYIAARPRDQRLPSDPRTPRATQRCSKRAWLGQIAKWRRDLHALADAPDAPDAPAQALASRTL
jgi:hypothetical protein